MYQAHYRAHTNIALIKYWGKRHHALFLPVTSSLSLTLDAFYTDSWIQFSDVLTEDSFILNGIPQDEHAIAKIRPFIQRFQDLADTNLHFRLSSVNHVPTAAGLASSASAFAALACACNAALSLNLSPRELSIMARQGSGSASRSLFGGFVEWHAGSGDDSQSSYAEPFDEANWDVNMIVVMVNQAQKPYSSRSGMAHTVETSPFYALWPEEVAKDLTAIKTAIQQHDFATMGAIAEHNAMKMHATMIAANPSFCYWEAGSLTAMKCVQQLRAQGVPCYFTMDAGPNVKILCQSTHLETIRHALLQHFNESQLAIAGPGPQPYALPIPQEFPTIEV